MFLCLLILHFLILNTYAKSIAVFDIPHFKQKNALSLHIVLNFYLVKMHTTYLTKIVTVLEITGKHYRQCFNNPLG